MTNISNIHAIISMTTIHTRIDNIDKVILSLLNQSHKNFKIQLYISDKPYLLDEGINQIPNTLKMLLGEQFEIKYTENTGPYRKLLPCLQENWHNQSQIIVTVDDDVVYPQDFLSTLLITNQFYDCPIAYRGREIKKENATVQPYADWKKSGVVGKSFSKLPTGKDGVLYKPCYFHDNVLDIEQAMLLCKTADDIWFKWHTLLNNKESVLLLDNLSESFPTLNPQDTITLFDKYNKSSKKDKTLNQNDIHINNMQKYVFEKFNFSLEKLW